MHFEKVSFEAWQRDVAKYSNHYFTDDTLKELYSQIKLPQRGTERSAGYDFFMPYNVMIREHSQVIVPSGIRWIPDQPITLTDPYRAREIFKVDFNFDWVLKMYVRSSLAIKRAITIAQDVAVIDADYYLNEKNEGDILLPFVNNGALFHRSKQGQRVVQGVIGLYSITDNDSPANKIRTGGVGSTGE